MTTHRNSNESKPAGPVPGKDAAKDSRKVDRDSADSMDASDPPSFNPGTSGAGEDRRSAKPKVADKG
jgi:hypothetical protein